MDDSCDRTFGLGIPYSQILLKTGIRIFITETKSKSETSDIDTDLD